MSAHHFNYDLWACLALSDEIRVEIFWNENIVNIDVIFENLRPNKYLRRN